MKDAGEQEWEVHPFIRLPLHNDQCQVCRAYCNHAIAMETRSAKILAEEMARVWGKHACRELRDGDKRLQEETKETRGEAEKLKIQAEEPKRSAEGRLETLTKQVDALIVKMGLEGEIERVKEQAEDLRRSAEIEIEQVKRQAEESKKVAESEIEQLRRLVEESKRSGDSKIEMLKNQAEESRRLAEIEIKQVKNQMEESKRSAETEIEKLRKQVGELKKSARGSKVEHGTTQAEESGKAGEGEEAKELAEQSKKSMGSNTESPVSSVGVSEQRNRQSSPGPTEIKPPRPPNDVVITQSHPVPTRRIGRADIVGFGINGVTILRNALDRSHIAKLELEVFGYEAGGWRVDRHVRLVGDTTGDGLADIIGFGETGVYVARNKGTSFSPPIQVLEDFCCTTGWWVYKHIRYVADLRGKGYVDIVGFGDKGVFVSLNNGDGTFAPPHLVLDDYGSDHGWNTGPHRRFLADVNGDGILDIVAFGDNRVFVSLGNGDGSFAPRETVINYELLNRPGGWGINKHSVTLADLTGDGRADIVGFGSDGVHVALNNGDGTFQAPKRALEKFDCARCGDWYSSSHLGFVADVNGDGLGDILVSGETGLWVAIGNRDGTFQDPKFIVRYNFYPQWGRVHCHPRFLIDLTGNRAVDIITYGPDAVWVSYNDGQGNFRPVERLTDEFCGWDMEKTVCLTANLGDS